MNQEQRLLIKKYLDIVIRRHKFILSGLLIGFIIGLGLYITIPKTYRCASLIQYQRQGINPTRLSPDDSSHPRNIVNTVSEQVLSRTTLENIIKEQKLYLELREKIPMEDVVETMREQISISPAGRGGEVHRVSYYGDNPRQVMVVTNTLASKFIEENLKFRQEQVSEASNYIGDELRMAQVSLDKKEAIMRDYKLEHYNELPSQQATNMSRLNALQQRYQESLESSHETERTLVLIREQISLREQLINTLNSQATLPQLGSQQPADTGMSTSMQIQLKLQQLRTKYTDNHPEIKRLEKLLADLGGVQTETDRDTNSDKLATKKQPSRAPDPQTTQLRLQLKDLQASLTRSKEFREKQVAEMEQLHSWINAAPIREAEWSALTRDYEQLQSHYQELVGRNIQAESAQSLERRQQGSQFKILDPARLPVKPFQPDFFKIMLLAVGMGLGTGGGLAAAIELLGTSFKNPQDLESFLNIPIVSVVPLIHTKQENKRINIIRWTWWALFCIVSCTVAAATLFLWMRGTIII